MIDNKLTILVQHSHAKCNGYDNQGTHTQTNIPGKLRGRKEGRKLETEILSRKISIKIKSGNSNVPG